MHNHLLPLIHLDSESYPFPTIFNWLNFETSALPHLGVYTIHNFWYLLKPTWIHQIQISSLPSKESYIRHIETSNNTTVKDITINSIPKHTIFFKTISMVLNISFTIFYSHTSEPTVIHPSTPSTIIKTIIIYKSVDDNYLYLPAILHPNKQLIQV